MAESEAAAVASKRVVMVTGGTGLVGSGIKEFVDSDPEVRGSRLQNQALRRRARSAFFTIPTAKWYK